MRWRWYGAALMLMSSFSFLAYKYLTLFQQRHYVIQLPAEVSTVLTRFTPRSNSDGAFAVEDTVPFLPSGHPYLGLIHSALPRTSFKQLPRLANQKQYDSMLRLLKTYNKVLRDFNVTWFMYYGTLLGSYVSHDVLPWDDDLDTVMEVSGMDLMKQLQDNGTLKEKYGLAYKCSRSLCKMFFSEEPNMGSFSYPWKWPFVDVIPIKMENGTLHNMDTKSPGHAFKVPTSWAFPTHPRPLGPLWLPAPRNPWRLLSGTYKSHKIFRCQCGRWDHIYERGRPKEYKAQCEQLVQDYPFVWRQARGNKTQETLRLGNKAVYTTVLDEPYYHHTNPYDWTYLKNPANDI